MRKLIAITVAVALIGSAGAPSTAEAKSSSSSKSRKSNHSTTAKKRVAKKPVSKPQPTPELPTYGPDGVPIVAAQSVIVVDAITGEILHEKNADELRPPASTQKLLTALVILESGDLFRRVVVQPEDVDTEPVKLNIRPGESYTRMELLQILLVHSPNDVARCLARDNAGSLQAFATKMNHKAYQLGLKSSHFINPNGLPAPGQYSTARDLARIAQAAYANRTIRSIVSMKSVKFYFADGRVRDYTNTNRTLLKDPFCNGMKTGYTASAGRCLIASGAAAGRDIIVVVLGDKTRTVWQDASVLLAWGLSS
jgi:D-alanyl-D-alanine carboxypeptidase (penicillin-binding protein 5/6)